VKVTPDLRFRIDDMYDRMDATRVMFAEDRVAKMWPLSRARLRRHRLMRWLVGLFLLASPAAAVTCQNIEYLGASYTICEVVRAKTCSSSCAMVMAICGQFSAVENNTGRTLAFAMNAGMYHEDRDPVGHYVEDGVQESVISSDGPGNFGLLPNGIFCIAECHRCLRPSITWIITDCYAVQSGQCL
jgi:uncharacterized protein YigE (DUF2233 family)